MGVMSQWGGRWSSVYSFRTCVNRALHVLGFSVVDDEEVALLSAPSVRLHLPRRWGRTVVLSHHPTPQYPDEPLCWVESSQTPYESSVFFLHFDSSDASNPDRAKLATSASTDDTPRSWLSVSQKTGRLSLTVSKHSATAFNVVASPQKGHPRFALQVICDAGQFLTISEPDNRARVIGTEKGFSTWLSIRLVPLPSTLSLLSEHPSDPTLVAVLNSPLVASIRIQSKSRGFHLTVKPGAVVTASKSRMDISWEAVTLNYDYYTKSALICDGRGAPLYVSDDHVHSVPDSWSKDKPSPGRSRQDRFGLRRVDDDDAVVISSRKGFLSTRGGGRIRLNKDTLPGDQERFILHIALPSQAGDRSPKVQLNVRENGVREVSAGISVTADPSIAFEVLTDYNGFKDFLEDASESEVLDRRNDRELSIRMVQCHSFLMLTIPISMTLDVLEEPERFKVTLSLIKGFGVREYKGLWEVIPLDNCQCKVTVRLRVATTIPAPGFLLNGLMSNAAAESMTQIREECLRRQVSRK